MAQYSAGAFLPYQVPKEGDGDGTTDEKWLPPRSTGGRLFASFLPSSTTYEGAAAGFPADGGATVTYANLQEHGGPVMAPDFSGFPAAFSTTLPPPNVTGTYYTQAPAGSMGGPFPAFGGIGGVPSCTGVPTDIPLQVNCSQSFCGGDVPEASAENRPSGIRDASGRQMAAQMPGGVGRRLQTQRQAHRAHPYGSSLLGRLVNKIASSLTSSFSSLVPRGISHSAEAQENANTPPAPATTVDVAARTESQAEAMPADLLYAPVQKSVYVTRFTSTGVNASASSGGMNTYPLRIPPAAGVPPDAGPERMYPPGAAPAASGAACKPEEKNRKQLRNNETSATRDGEVVWLSDEELSLSYQQIRAASAATPSHLPDSGHFFNDEKSSCMADYSQPRQQQQQQPLQQSFQQRLRRHRVPTAERGRARGGGVLDAEVTEARRDARTGAASTAEHGDDEMAYSSLSVDDSVPKGTAASEMRPADTRRIPTNEATAAQAYSYYEIPRQRLLGESCFDTAAAQRVAVDVDTNIYGASSCVPLSINMQQQPLLFDLPREGRSWGSGETAAENLLAEDVIVCRANNVSPSAARKGVADTGRRLKTKEKWGSGGHQQNRLLAQKRQPQSLLGTSGASYLYHGKEFSKGVSQNRRHHHKMLKGGTKHLQEIQKDSGPDISLSLTGSTSARYSGADRGVTRVRRGLREGRGGGSSSLFSQSATPAWLSSATTATADLLDADGRRKGEGAAAGATGGHGSGSSGRFAPRSSTVTGIGTRKAAHDNRNATLLHARQEQLTVEQLQKLYLRCHLLRWRVRLRDLLKQEAAVAAAAWRKERQVSAQNERIAAAAVDTVKKTPVGGKTAGAAAEKKTVTEKGIETQSLDSSTQVQQERKEASQEETGTGKVFPAADGAATPRAPSQQERQAAGKSEFAAGTAGEANMEDKDAGKDETQPTDKAGEGSGVAARAGVCDKEGRTESTAKAVGVANVDLVSGTGAAAEEVTGPAGSKRSKLGSGKAITDGGSLPQRGATSGSGVSNVEGTEIRSSTLFGSSGTSLFGAGRTMPVTGSLEGQKPETGRLVDEPSDSAKVPAGEKAGLPLFGKPPTAPSTVSAPLFGSSSSSSLFAELTAATPAQKQQQKDAQGSSVSGVLGGTATSLFGGTGPASGLFGGVRSSSAQQQQLPHGSTLQQASGPAQPLARQQTEKETSLRGKEAAGGGSTPEQESKDTVAPGGTAAVTAGAATSGVGGAGAAKPAGDTSALPWWQQNLGKPCAVMPEEDFAPEPDDDEEEVEDKNKEKAAPKELPPLKVPSLFGNSSSGLFGSTAPSTSSMSLFKAETKPSPLTAALSSAAPPSSSTAATGPPSLFGAAAAGAGSLWGGTTSSGSSLFGGLKPPATAPSAFVPSGSLFGGPGTSAQQSTPKPAATAGTSSLTSSSASSESAAEKPPPSLFGSPPGSSSAFATQKATASLFGGSIFGNPVAAAQGTSLPPKTGGSSAAPAAAPGLFVFGAGAGSSSSSTPAPPANTAVPAGQPQAAGGVSSTLPSLFGSALQPPQPQPSSSTGTGKRGREAAESEGAAAPPATKSLFGAAPAAAGASAAGGKLGLFGQGLRPGGTTLFGGGGGTGSTSLFNMSGPVPGSSGQPGEKGEPAKTGAGGGGSLFGDRHNSGGSIFGAARSVTPVFGGGSTGKDSSSGSGSAAGAGSANAAAPAAAPASTSSSLGLFGSSSNNNPFGFGGSARAPAVSLFGGGSTSTPGEGSRSSTADNSFTAGQPLWSASKGSTTVPQGLFSLGVNSTPAAMAPGATRTFTGAPAGGVSNGAQQAPQRSLFGEVASGIPGSTPGTVGARTTMGIQGGSLFGSTPNSAGFAFGAAPANPVTQQQQQQPTSGASGPPVGAPSTGGPEAGSGTNSFFGALPSGVRRPRLTIKRSKQ